jgi:hypothetical protein
LTEPPSELAVVDQLRPFLTDDAMYGRMHADLHDLIEVGEWLSAESSRRGDEPLTADQAETFLVELDVHLVEHATWHLNSLRKDIASALANIASRDS